MELLILVDGQSKDSSEDSLYTELTKKNISSVNLEDYPLQSEKHIQ